MNQASSREHLIFVPNQSIIRRTQSCGAVWLPPPKALRAPIIPGDRQGRVAGGVSTVVGAPLWRRRSPSPPMELVVYDVGYSSYLAALAIIRLLLLRRIRLLVLPFVSFAQTTTCPADAC
jgi:hypothetical protein